jgi:hypothetical protein
MVSICWERTRMFSRAQSILTFAVAGWHVGHAAVDLCACFGFGFSIAMGAMLLVMRKVVRLGNR